MRVREAYVNANQGAKQVKAAEWGITRLWFEWDDHSKDLLTGRSGVKMNGASSIVARNMDDALKGFGFGPSTQPGSCGAAFDPEPFHAGDVEELLIAWRLLRPRRYTQLWLPPWQGGLFTPMLAHLINTDPNLLVVVQLYMEIENDPLYPASFRAIDELVNLPNNCAIDRAKLVPFWPVKSYAGAGVEIPYGWDGLLWTFDALPAAPPAPL